MPVADPRRRFGTFTGVFVPTLLTILGVIMYVRVGWVVGNGGLLGAWLIMGLALAITAEDEVITTVADMDRGRYIKDTVFNFAEHRRTEHYGIITGQTAAKAPPE